MNRANSPVHPTNIGMDVNGNEYLMKDGLTIREHFAAMAMWSSRNPHNSMDHEAAAHWAGIEAEALIAELAKPAQP